MFFCLKKMFFRPQYLSFNKQADCVLLTRKDCLCKLLTISEITRGGLDESEEQVKNV